MVTRPSAIVAVPMWIVVRPSFASVTDDVMDPKIGATGIVIVATPQASGEKPRPDWNITLSASTMPPIAPMNVSTSARPMT